MKISEYFLMSNNINDTFVRTSEWELPGAMSLMHVSDDGMTIEMTMIRFINEEKEYEKAKA